MFWPTDLAVIYPHPGAWPWISVALAAFVLLMITVFALRFRRRAPYLAVGWFWYLGTLVPVIGLVQIGSHAMADRYTYLPLIGLFIMIVWGMTDMLAPWRHGRALVAVGGLAIVLAFIPTARAQVAYWKDAERLFRRAVVVTERNYLAHNNLGAALARKGSGDEALRHYREALAIQPRYPDALFNAGAVLAVQGRYAEAETYYRAALAIHPSLAEAHNNLAIALVMQGNMHDAISHFRTAVHLRPDYAEAEKNLALALRGVKRKPSDYR
jgi:tetratricopeptide (TPR) repeat protein